jgi:hypothetical protein
MGCQVSDVSVSVISIPLGGREILLRLSEQDVSVVDMTEHGATFDIYSSITAISRISVIQDILCNSASLSLSLHQMISFSSIGSRQRIVSITSFVKEVPTEEAEDFGSSFFIVTTSPGTPSPVR